MAKQWLMREKVSDDLEEQLLHFRKIKLLPDYEKDLADPMEMLGMEKAVERILKAIKDNERIIIFGDYDADGVSASVIFFEFFKKIDFKNFHVHIPDRHLDGYGMTLESIDEFKKQKAKLIITLDCGITDCEEIKKANKNKIDVIVIDHHLPPEKLPEAFAIIDVKQKNDQYPFKEFVGAGAAFKTIQALAKKMKITPGWEKWLLDLVAIGTISDMFPLVGENRTLVYYGLQVFKKTRRAGLISLCQRTGINLKNINEDDISFMLGPRINVASRMEHANTSFELLTTESKEEAEWLAAKIEMMTKERKNLVEKILEEIDEKINKEKIPEVIVVGDLNWNPGILGLTATRTVEKYNRPAVLWGKAGAKEIKSSGRSDGTIDLVELMELLPKNIIFDFGGHRMAGGFSVYEKEIKNLEPEILKAWEKIPKQKIESEILEIDKEIGLEDVDENFYSVIEKFQPFGVGNPKPVFKFSNLEIKNVKKFGNAGLHLQLDFKNISAIGFFFNSKPGFELLKPGQKIDLAATLEKSFFYSPPQLRLRIVDVILK